MLLSIPTQAERDACKYKGWQAVQALATIDQMHPERAAALRPHLEAEAARWQGRQRRKPPAREEPPPPRPESRQLELFGEDVLPRRPFACDRFSENRRRALEDALACKYIQVNQPSIDNFIVVDCDHSDPRWHSSGLPQPCWVAATKCSGRHHVAYRLKSGVLTSSAGRRAPQGLLHVVRRALTARLVGDPCYVGLLTKNPLHEAWNVQQPGGSTSLEELAKVLRPELAALTQWDACEPGRPRWSQAQAEAELRAAGDGTRNVTLFTALRQWAYRNLDADLHRQALRFNSMLPDPLPASEVEEMAARMARYLAGPRFVSGGFTSDFAEAQRRRGRLSGVARLAASEDKRASARLMRAQGQSIRAIAAALGVGKSTVSDWCRGDKCPVNHR